MKKADDYLEVQPETGSAAGGGGSGDDDSRTSRASRSTFSAGSERVGSIVAPETGSRGGGDDDSRTSRSTTFSGSSERVAIGIPIGNIPVEPGGADPIIQSGSGAKAEEEEEEEQALAAEETELYDKLLGMADDYLRFLNEHDLHKMSQLATNDSKYEFFDVQGNLIHEMNFEIFHDFVENNMFPSFPDFTLKRPPLSSEQQQVVRPTMKRITTTTKATETATRKQSYDHRDGEEEENDDDAHRNKDDDLISFGPFEHTACGTHTGAPYSFGPCKPIEATGKFIQLDPEWISFIFRRRRRRRGSDSDDDEFKVCKFQVRGSQELTGPAGFYTKLGGFPLLGTLPPSLPPPAPPPPPEGGGGEGQNRKPPPPAPPLDHLPN